MRKIILILFLTLELNMMHAQAPYQERWIGGQNLNLELLNIKLQSALLDGIISVYQRDLHTKINLDSLKKNPLSMRMYFGEKRDAGNYTDSSWNIFPLNAWIDDYKFLIDTQKNRIVAIAPYYSFGFITAMRT